MYLMGKKNEDSGCVGFGSGGYLKQSSIHVFSTDDNKPESVLEEHREYYGDGYTIKYVNSDNPEKILGKLKAKIKDHSKSIKMYKNVIGVNIKTAADILRPMGDKEKLSTCGKKPKKSKKDDDSDSDSDDDKKKSKSKGKKNKKKDDDSDSDSDNDKKKSKGKKNKKKDADSDSDSDSKKKKKSKSKGKKNESSGESESDSD